MCWAGETCVGIPDTPRGDGRGPQSSKAWEVLKSFVYGGLAELLASLSVVTSAASADATTCTKIYSLLLINVFFPLLIVAFQIIIFYYWLIQYYTLRLK